MKRSTMELDIIRSIVNQNKSVWGIDIDNVSVVIDRKTWTLMQEMAKGPTPANNNKRRKVSRGVVVRKE